MDHSNSSVTIPTVDKISDLLCKLKNENKSDLQYGLYRLHMWTLVTHPEWENQGGGE